MSYITLYYYLLFAAGWHIVNGILHDIFVLIQRRPYEKELIRLLIDGHILIFGGVFFLIAAIGIKNNDSRFYILGITTAVFLIGYCALIFKMLPSVGTLLVCIIALVWLLAAWVKG